MRYRELNISLFCAVCVCVFGEFGFLKERFSTLRSEDAVSSVFFFDFFEVYTGVLFFEG